MALQICSQACLKYARGLLRKEVCSMQRLLQSSTTHFEEGPSREAPPAFVFDIDGVLIRGQRVLPAALAMADRLTEGTGQWRYPVVFMTNSGGCTEQYKADQLSKWLRVPVAASQVILSHTPMRDLVPRFGDQPVLVSGRGDAVPDVAREYGFQHVATTDQLGRSRPEATPFATYQERVQSSERCPVVDGGMGSEQRPFRAILVMTDPGDWYRDMQLMLDIITGHGVFDREPSALDPRAATPVEVYFSHADLLWANDFPRNRLAQGGFAIALSALHNAVTGRPLPHAKWYGKPTTAPYRLAERMLVQQASDLGFAVSSASQLNGIYAVGDNPAADVRGANGAGSPWLSVLVKTGVFQGPGANCPRDPAAIVVDDVAGGVAAALHRARHNKWHSMR